MNLHRLTLYATIFLTACGSSAHVTSVPSAGGVSKSEPHQGFVLSDQDVETIVANVSSARQLEPKHPIAVARLERDKFVDQLTASHGGSEDAPGSDLTPEAAFLVGFDFVPEPSKRKQIAALDDVLKEQVVGFYDSELDQVFVPDVTLHSEKDLLEQRAVLAHEVQHALQAQRFPKLPKATSSDESIAHLSLTEGDAMVAMGALLGAEGGAPVGRTLRRIVEVTKRVPLAAVTRGEATKELDHALELTRKRLEFPYEEGMLFVSDVYRAGGFPLVDKMYGAPPRSSEQILHPEKYLAGEQPRTIGAPKLAGYTVATVDTLGELDTRILLGRCLDTDVAGRAAAGWAGDRFSVLVGSERRLSVAWISAWDTEDDAKEMEEALAKSGPCWHGNAVGLEKADYVINAQHSVWRQGKSIAFLRGFPQKEESGIANQLFALVGPEPKSTPLTDLKIPARKELPEPVLGRVNGDVYQNDWLGLVGRIPQGMTAAVGHEGLELLIDRQDALVAGAVSVSTRITSEAQNEKTFREVQDAFVAEVGKLDRAVLSLGQREVQTALGNGIERSWAVAGTPVELRMILIPVCAGTGSVVFVQVYGDTYARAVLDGWLASFRWTHGRNLKACDFLDPK